MFSSATYSTGSGQLAITFSESLNGTVHLDRLHVRDSGESAGGVTLSGAPAVSGATLTVTLTPEQRTAVESLGTPQLDIDAGAVSDANDNEIAASPDNAIAVDDTAPPVFSSATYSTGSGQLAITFSESLNGTVHLDRLHVRDSGQSSGGATLTGAAQSVAGSALTVTLTPEQRTAVESLGTPQLDIDAGAVSDANDNEIAASPDNAIAVDDTAPPVFSSATYSTGSGQLAITFSESLNGTVHLDRLHVRDSGQSSGGATLTGAAQSVAGSALTVTLTPEQRTAVESLGTPQLDIDAGAVSDANDNEIAASPDNAIAVDDTAPPVFSSATYSTGSGQLAITFSESLNGTVHLDRLHVRDSGQSSGGATLTGAAQSVAGSALTVTLTPEQRTAVESLGTPQLDIDAGAVSDANDNEIAASPDNAIAVDDTAPPVFSSATYSTGSGQLAITFSESLNGTVHTTGCTCAPQVPPQAASTSRTSL